MPAASSATLTAPRLWLKQRIALVRGLLLGSATAGLLTGVLVIVQAGIMARLIGTAAQHELSLPDLWQLIAVLVGVIVGRALGQWLQEICGHEAGLRVRRQIRSELIVHLNRLGPARLSEHNSADLAGRILENSEALDGYYARFLPQLFLATALPLLILLLVFRLDWLAAIFLLLSAPLIPLFMALVGMGAERLNRDQIETLGRLAGLFLDRVRGLTTLQLFNHAERSVAEVVTASDEYRRRSMRTLRIAFLSSAVLEFFAAVAVAAVAIYIGFGLLGYIEYGPAPALTLESGLFILLLAPEFFQPLRQLSQYYHDRAAALAAADNLSAFLDQPAGAAPANGPMSAPVTTGVAVELSAVSVDIADRGRVLGPVTLEMAAGSLVAVRGPSGAGKSTLLQLIAGFRQADAGAVRIGGQVPTGHGHLAWMDQRPFLLHGTIRENLRLAAPGASESTLQEALKAAGLQDWIEQLPAGLETAIGEQGTGLSGGQAQRLALARVFLSPAPLVLLDEPTAHLDAASEAVVIQGLQALRDQGRTIIIASHQQAVLDRAEQVIDLEQGKLRANSHHG